MEYPTFPPVLPKRGEGRLCDEEFWESFLFLMQGKPSQSSQDSYLTGSWRRAPCLELHQQPWTQETGLRWMASRWKGASGGAVQAWGHSSPRFLVRGINKCLYNLKHCQSVLCYSHKTQPVHLVSEWVRAACLPSHAWFRQYGLSSSIG